MNILNIEHVTKSFGDGNLFDDVSYGVHQGDKIGVIGVNGTGKSTLLKMIAGLEETDAGEITSGNGIRMTYLPQNPEFPAGATILSYVVEGKSNKNWNAESEAKTILTKLGIYDFDGEIEYLSGGQKKRVALARTLVVPADVLILDEPTNHIDNDMAIWLEQYLGKFKGVLIMVTHDRYFLDRVTNKILEIDNGKLYAYETNYSGFVELKAQREDSLLATERKRQSILRTELAWVKRGARARSTKQKARLERYEELKNMDAPKEEQNVEMDSVGTRLGKKTIELHHISKSYPPKILIKDYTYIFLRDQRLGIVGANGCGKSTLVKMMMGEVTPDEGEIIIGETIKIGYFAQENETMQEDIRVIDYIRNVAEYIQTSKGEATASQMLERFLFSSTMQYTLVANLSGGEKRRLYLLKVLMSAPNVLILDEPTNDLDISTLTILEDYLDSFSGIVIAVSHDRYFLDRVVDRIIAFEGEGLLRQYEGGYSDYLEKKQEQEEQAKIILQKGTQSKASTWKSQQPREIKLKFSYQEQKDFECMDETIEELESQLEALEVQIQESASMYTKLGELMEKKQKVETKLEESMERWVYLNDLADKIKEQKEQKENQ